MKRIILFGVWVMIVSLLSNCERQHSVLIYGHRGARALVPENTIPAYQKAIDLNVDCVDMDVNMTKDGVVVVTHDFTLNPEITRDQSGEWIQQKTLIKDLTFDQLAQFDVGRIDPHSEYAKRFPDQTPVDGTHIPSLEEVIRYVESHAKHAMCYQIEIKSDPRFPNKSFSPRQLAEATVAILHELDVADRAEIQSFDWRALAEIQRLDSTMKTAYLTDKERVDQMKSDDRAYATQFTNGHLLADYENSVPRMVAELGGKIWGPCYSDISAESVAEAHRYGLKVVPWGVNNMDEMRDLIKMRVDGIIADHPEWVEKL